MEIESDKFNKNRTIVEAYLSTSPREYCAMEFDLKHFFECLSLSLYTFFSFIICNLANIAIFQ